VDTKLGKVIRIASGQVDPKNAAIARLVSVGPENILVGGGLIPDSLKTAKELGQISGKYAFDSDAILYSKIRPNLNKIALPDFDGICSADMYPIWVRDKQIANQVYLYYVVNSEKFVSDATARSFRTGLPKINRPDLESIKILLPPLPEQRKIAEILRTWDEGLAALTAKARRLDSLRAALLFGDLRHDNQRRNWKPRRLARHSLVFWRAC
jgi:type I restriction enzyme, S subunit